MRKNIDARIPMLESTPPPGGVLFRYSDLRWRETRRSTAEDKRIAHVGHFIALQSNIEVPYKDSMIHVDVTRITKFTDEHMEKASADELYMAVIPQDSDALPEDMVNMNVKMNLRNGESVGFATSGIRRNNRGLTPDKKLPPGVGIALYRTAIEEVLPHMVREFGKPITHQVWMDLEHGDKRIEKRKWLVQFAPILQANGYVQSEQGHTWRRTFTPEDAITTTPNDNTTLKT